MRNSSRDRQQPGAVQQYLKVAAIIAVVVILWHLAFKPTFSLIAKVNGVDRSDVRIQSNSNTDLFARNRKLEKILRHMTAINVDAKIINGAASHRLIVADLQNSADTVENIAFKTYSVIIRGPYQELLKFNNEMSDYEVSTEFYKDEKNNTMEKLELWLIDKNDSIK